MVLVLLIDDEPDLREELKLGLENGGYIVTVAACGNEGLTLFTKQPFDVVITDVIMDEGEGVETMRGLHELAPDLPIIAISGNPRYLKTMGKLGAAFRLLKPFSIKALIKAIELVL